MTKLQFCEDLSCSNYGKKLQDDPKYNFPICKGYPIDLEGLKRACIEKLRKFDFDNDNKESDNRMIRTIGNLLNIDPYNFV